MIIFSNTLGITSVDVHNCDDTQLLTAWLNQIEFDVSNAKAIIIEHKAKYSESSDYEQKRKYIAAIRYSRLQITLKKQIEHRLNYLKQTSTSTKFVIQFLKDSIKEKLGQEGLTKVLLDLEDGLRDKAYKYYYGISYNPTVLISSNDVISLMSAKRYLTQERINDKHNYGVAFLTRPARLALDSIIKQLELDLSTIKEMGQVACKDENLADVINNFNEAIKLLSLTRNKLIL